MPPEYNPAALAQAINEVGIPMMIARGNCDADVDQLVIKVPMQSPYALVSMEGMRILVTHGDKEILSQEEIIANHQVDLWVSGHTHIPALRTKGSVLFVNPGSLGLPKAEEASLAIVEGKQVSIIGVETGQTLEVTSLS